MPKFIDLTGKIFGRLKVIKRVSNSPHNEVRWLCLCECGEKPIIKSGALKRKNKPTRSCGCLNKEGNSAKSRNLGEIKRTFFRREKLAGLYPAEWNDLPPTRKVAQDSNIYSPTYFNANFCIKNHLAPSYTFTGRCVDCALRDQRKKDKKIREQRAKNITEKNEFRFCPECKIPFLMLPEYQKDKKFCTKKCAGAKSKRNYSIENPEKVKISKKNYFTKMIEEKGMPYKKMRLRASAFHRKRYKNDPAYKIKHLYRTRLIAALNYQRQGKTYPSLDYLGCSVDEFAKFIEQQFDPKRVEMNWNNHSQFGWHLDHVRPCESFDFSDINQVFTCFNYRNFQPLWFDENISKSNNYDEEDEMLWIKRMRNLGYQSDLYPKYLKKV